MSVGQGPDSDRPICINRQDIVDYAQTNRRMDTVRGCPHRMHLSDVVFERNRTKRGKPDELSIDPPHRKW